MQTRGDLIQKRPRISTYLSESFSAICWIFSETFCSGAIAKLHVLVAVDPARSRPRRRPLAMRSRGETGKCQDRLAPGKAMQLRATRLESLRVLALDAIDAEEDDETGAERRRKAEHGQTRSGIVSQYWDKCPNIGTSRNQVPLGWIPSPAVF